MMDLPLHPGVVHIPVGLSFVMPIIVVAMGWGVLSGRLPKMAWSLVVVLQLVLSVSSFVAAGSGDLDKGLVEAVVDQEFIDAHEDAASLFIWSSAGMFIVAALGIALSDDRARRIAIVAMMAGSVVVGYLGVRTGQAGGILVYRRGAASAHLPADVLRTTTMDATTERAAPNRDARAPEDRSADDRSADD